MSTAYYLGYALALLLYKDMGRIFFVPMLLNMIFNVLLNLGVYQDFDFRWMAAIQGFLFFLWIVFIVSSDRRKTDVVVAVLLMLAALFYGTLPGLLREADTFKSLVDITSEIWTFWDIACFAISFMVLIRSSLIAWLRKEFVDVLTNPRKRFLIPLCIQAGIVGSEPLLRGFVPQDVLVQRFNVGSMFLVWGWVAVELPFYIMYERLRRKMD